MNSRIISPGDIKMRLANCVQNKQGSSFVFLVKIKEEMDIFLKREITQEEQAGGKNMEKGAV